MKHEEFEKAHRERSLYFVNFEAINAVNLDDTKSLLFQIIKCDLVFAEKFEVNFTSKNNLAVKIHMYKIFKDFK